MLYLSKLGKVTGPFEEAEIEKLRASGELFNFSWMWNDMNPGWVALDPPPAFAPSVMPQGTPKAKPVVAKPIPAPRVLDQPVEIVRQKKAPAIEIPSDLSFSAICHDFRSAVAGKLECIDENGAQLLVEGKANIVKFAAGERMQLNLLDEKRGKSLKVEAFMGEIRRHGDGWMYKLMWKEFPSQIAA